MGGCWTGEGGEVRTEPRSWRGYVSAAKRVVGDGGGGFKRKREVEWGGTCGSSRFCRSGRGALAVENSLGWPGRGSCRPNHALCGGCRWGLVVTGPFQLVLSGDPRKTSQIDGWFNPQNASGKTVKP